MVGDVDIDLTLRDRCRDIAVLAQCSLAGTTTAPQQDILHAIMTIALHGVVANDIRKSIGLTDYWVDTDFVRVVHEVLGYGDTPDYEGW